MLIAGTPTPISRRTYRFLIRNYKEEAEIWMDHINDIILELCEKWNMTITGQEEQSQFGCILYGKSNGTDVVLKLIPPCCSRLRDEISCYFYLPYSSMVELYAYDLKLGGFLLKRIRNYPIKDLGKIASIFHTMYSERRVAKEAGSNSYGMRFRESLRTAEDAISGCSDEKIRGFLQYIARAENAYSTMEGNPAYLLHGDAHIHNILDDGQNLFLIDPIGYVGPFEIEYARFLGTYIRENNLYHTSLKDLIRLVCGDDCPIENISCALGYDVTMRACNTFMEGNTDLEILDAILWSEKIWKMIDQA